MSPSSSDINLARTSLYLPAPLLWEPPPPPLLPPPSACLRRARDYIDLYSKDIRFQKASFLLCHILEYCKPVAWSSYLIPTVNLLFWASFDQNKWPQLWCITTSVHTRKLFFNPLNSLFILPRSKYFRLRFFVVVWQQVSTRFQHLKRLG